MAPGLRSPPAPWPEDDAVLDMAGPEQVRSGQTAGLNRTSANCLETTCWFGPAR